MKRLLPSDATRIRAFVAGRRPAHLAGAGGVGMAGVAHRLHSLGVPVTGCDLAPSRVADWLRREGIPVEIGHAPSHIAGAEWVIRSPAVPRDHPEIREADARGIPVYDRGLVLPILIEGARSVAVAGTHGKTTTAALLAHILEAAGCDPSFCIGGEIDDAGRVARSGGGDGFVVEADESDGSLVNYRPSLALVTNVELDHMETFGREESLRACFAEFAGNASDGAIACADDPGSMLAARAARRVRTFGLGDAASIRADDVALDAGGSRFRLRVDGRDAGTVALPIPGMHNVVNALGALAAAVELGLDASKPVHALREFHPVRRRFEVVLDCGDWMIVSDYAHHPTEIRACVRAALGQGRKRVVALFQPHRFTRTRDRLAEFPPAFEGVEAVILAPVYAASECPVEGGTSADLHRQFARDARVPCSLVASLDEAWNHARSILRPGDLFLVVGAGDVEQVAETARRWAERMKDGQQQR